jgi:hypothetical protein
LVSYLEKMKDGEKNKRWRKNNDEILEKLKVELL